MLSGNIITDIPDEINELESLEILHLNDNNIKAIDVELDNLKNIKEIDLSSNKLSSSSQSIKTLKDRGVKIHTTNNVFSNIYGVYTYAVAIIFIIIMLFFYKDSL